MGKTVRKFRGKPYRQGHEPAELELTRIRVALKEEAVSRWEQEEIQEALASAAEQEQEDMGYAEHGCRVFLDGDMWCVLQGEDLVVGIAGFGKTIDEAWEDYEENLLK